MDCALQCGNRRLTIEQTTSIYTVGNVQRFVEEHPLENNSNPSSILFTFQQSRRFTQKCPPVNSDNVINK